jgi:hypothetical protein
MPATFALSSDTGTTAGILLLTILAVEFGGLTVLRIVRGHQPATGFQKTVARAGVFVIFALIRNRAAQLMTLPPAQPSALPVPNVRGDHDGTIWTGATRAR